VLLASFVRNRPQEEGRHVVAEAEDGGGLVSPAAALAVFVAILAALSLMGLTIAAPALLALPAMRALGLRPARVFIAARPVLAGRRRGALGALGPAPIGALFPRPAPVLPPTVAAAGRGAFARRFA
jgi:hypothetical protein